MNLYPLKFKSIFKERIWGGDKVKTLLNKDFSPLQNCGETWELSGEKNNISTVLEGELQGKKLNEVISLFKDKILGGKVYQQFGNTFPLLVKFIDTRDDLSIQVHPDDKLAYKRHDSFGKTEMWYVMQADENARLAVGFNKSVTKNDYIQALQHNSLSKILNYEKTKANDAFFVPAGCVHAIGKGVMLAEIQQASNITYRIYDFDRVDGNGNKRQLHVEESIDAIDFQHCKSSKIALKEKRNNIEKVVKCQYFETNRIFFDRQIIRDYYLLDSFVALVCVEGKCTLKIEGCSDTQLQKGEVILISACFKSITLLSTETTKILEVYIP